MTTNAGIAQPCSTELHVRSSSTPHGCTATRHGTADAYNHHGCRCPIARRALRRQVKARQLAHLQGRPPLVDATGTRRRLQALAAVGHSLTDIAAELGCSKNTVHEWQTRHAPVTRATRDVVAATYLLLADRSPVGPRVARVRNDARRNGWLSPLWWDDDTIDDPLFIGCSTTDSPTPSSVDPVVVERLIAGQPPLHVTRAERAEAVRLLDSRGWTRSLICQRLAMSGGRVAQILDGECVSSNKNNDADNNRQEASA